MTLDALCRLLEQHHKQPIWHVAIGEQVKFYRNYVDHAVASVSRNWEGWSKEEKDLLTEPEFWKAYRIPF